MNKKNILFTIISLIISVLIISISSKYNLFHYNNKPQQLYRVYLAGKSIGIIESKSELEDYIDKKQEQLKKKYQVSKIYAPNDLDIMKEITYNEKTTSIEEIYKKIEKLMGSSSFTIDGYKIIIEGSEKESNEEETFKTENQIIYVLDKEIFTKSVEKTVTAFIKPEMYDLYINNNQKTLEENETGIIIENLSIKNNIKIRKERIPAGEKIYQSEEELSKYLLFGTTEEQKKYTVKAGDTIEEISDNNKLSTEEFLIANPNFTTAQDLLYPGQVVKLGLINPQFDLEEIEHVVSKKTIYKETIYKDDSTQYVGYEKVEEEGRDGLALVTEKIKLINGEIMDTQPVGKHIEISPAINKVIVRGTKKKEYTGTGNGSLGPDTYVPVDIGSWVWPTVAPYTITSNFAWRWGKLHEGTDISGGAAVYNSPIKAANNGIVVESAFTSTNGNYIIIKHSNNVYTIYGHMASRNKEVGDIVMAGEQIGRMGATGFVTGVHLHFGTYNGYPFRGGVAFNALNLYR